MPSAVRTIALPATPKSRSNPSSISISYMTRAKVIRTSVPDTTTVSLNTHLKVSFATFIADRLDPKNRRVCVGAKHGNRVARLFESINGCLERLGSKVDDIPSISYQWQKPPGSCNCESNNIFHLVYRLKPRNLSPASCQWPQSSSPIEKLTLISSKPALARRSFADWTAWKASHTFSYRIGPGQS